MRLTGDYKGIEEAALPCPFCGCDKPRVHILLDSEHRRYKGLISCNRCSAMMSTAWKRDKKRVMSELVVRWNRREWLPRTRGTTVMTYTQGDIADMAKLLKEVDKEDDERQRENERLNSLRG